MNSDIDPHAVLHVPHDSIVVPPDARDAFTLDDDALADELRRMTDHLTWRLFDGEAYGARAVRARVSRLVVDVERFVEDAAEPMAARGMGVLYEARHDGSPLRRALADDERRALLDAWYHPHHLALERAVEAALGRDGTATVVDAHSFPRYPQPYEPDQRADRPEICIGTDDFHTPDAMRRAFVDAFGCEGFGVEVNRPFAGALVPSRHHRSDARVRAVMIEVRRDLYLDEASGEASAGFEDCARRTRRAVAAALRACRESMPD